MPVTSCARDSQKTVPLLTCASLCLLLVSSLLGSGCTPFKDVDRNGSLAGNAAADEDGGALAGGGSGMSGSGGGMKQPAAEGGPCMAEGARTCATMEPQVPLRCEGASWSRQGPCEQDERCEDAVGCVALPRDCVGRPIGEDYCDGELRRTCGEATGAPARSCGPQRRCRMIGGQAECVCAPFTSDQGNGCEQLMSCGVANGGCDMLTICSLASGMPTCSMCPPGYMGDGIDGCKPELVTLQVSSGPLSPALAHGVHAYRVRLPLMQQRLTLSASGPTGTSLEINGSVVQPGVEWTSPVLPLGEQVIALLLTTQTGGETRYELTVDRAGVQEAYIKASRPDAEDAFGNGLAIWGDTLVAGATLEDSAAGGFNADQANNGAVDSGAAYVFTRRADGWAQEAFLKAQAPGRSDFFGTSVAIWEDTIAVGSPRASPIGNTTSTNGVVDIFVRAGSSWAFQERLVSPEAGSFDLFGWSMTLTKSRLVVGAPYDGAGAQRSGAVYVFERNGSAWSAPTKLKAREPTAFGALGWSVALDADTILAGSIERNGMSTDMGGPGSAFVFTNSSTGWVQQQKLQAPVPSDGASFGWSVAVRGDLAAIGAPRADLLRSTLKGDVYLFERTGERWQSSAMLQADVPRRSDYFGSSVAIAGDVIAIGASGDASSARGLNGETTRSDLVGSGAIYVFGRQGNTWVRSAYIKSSNPDARDYLGDQIALFGDTVVTSAITESSGSMGVGGDDTSNTLPKSGAVYVFR